MSAEASAAAAEAGETVVEVLRRHAAARGEQAALAGGGYARTYAELAEEVETTARALVAAAGGGSEPVAVVMEHGGRALSAMLGILQAGKMYVALDGGHPLERLRGLMRACGARVVMHDAQSAAVAARLEAAVRLDVGALPEPGAAELPAVGGRTPACIVFTSGTTGEPKGIVLDHGNVLHRARCFVEGTGAGREDRVALLAHGGLGASITPTFGALLAGSTLLPFCVATHGLEKLAAFLRDERITVMQAVPTVLRRLACESAAETFAALRVVRIAGESLAPADAAALGRAMPHCRLLLAYATTETGTLTEMDVAAESPPGAVGRAVRGVEIVVVNEAHEPAGMNERGEIAGRGRHFNRGYFAQGEFSAGTPAREAGEVELVTYFTGDMGRLDGRGVLYWEGRRDAQVKIRGQRIELQAIEAALRGLANVRAAAAGVYEMGAEKKLAAYVVPEDFARADVKAWRAALAGQLPGGQVPDAFVLLSQLPITPAGKLDRAALPAPAVAAAREVRRPPRDHLEKTLAGIWEGVLGISGVNRDDSFFSLGGDSLSAVAIVGRIEAEIGQMPPLSLFLQAATIEEQAAALAAGRARATSTIVTLQPLGEKPPWYCIHGADGEVFGFSALAGLLGKERAVFGVQSPGMLGEWPARTLQELAARHARDIAEHNKGGACRLLGHCAGGLLAAEIGRELAALGVAVELVVLIDAAVPRKTPGVRSASFRRRLTDAVAHWFRTWRWRWKLARQERGGKGEARQTAAYRRFVDHAFKDAFRRHSWKAYEGSALLLLADEETFAAGADPREMLARDYFAGAQTAKIAGTHLGCMKLPQVESIARVLRAAQG